MTDKVFLERRTVSRKTPGDGRLEITKQTAQFVEPYGERLTVELGGEVVQARLGTMECTCRGAQDPHIHYFLQSEGFKRLTPESAVAVELDPARARVLLQSPD
jgi:hypothetical protein